MLSRSKLARLRDMKWPAGLTISHSGERLAVKSGPSGAIGLYDLASLRLLGATEPPGKEGADPVFTPDDQFIVDADWDGDIRLVNATTLAVTVLRQYPDCMVLDIDHTSGSDHFLFQISPKTIGTPAFSSEVLVDWPYPFDQHAPIEQVTPFRRLGAIRRSPIRGVVAALNGKPEGNEVILLDPTMTQITAQSEVKPNSGSAFRRALAWSTDEQFLVVLRRGKVEILEVATLTVVHEIALEYACFVDFTPDGTALLLGSWQSGYYIPFSEVWNVTRLA